MVAVDMLQVPLSWHTILVVQGYIFHKVGSGHNQTTTTIILKGTEWLKFSTAKHCKFYVCVHRQIGKNFFHLYSMCLTLEAILTQIL